MRQITAALRRVRGVCDLKVDARVCEIVVTRYPGSAPDAQLLRTLQKTGYPGKLLPIHQAKLHLEGVRSRACAQRLQACLGRVRGVREVSMPGRSCAEVTYDGRRTSPTKLVRAAERAGVRARVGR